MKFHVFQTRKPRRKDRSAEPQTDAATESSGLGLEPQDDIENQRAHRWSASHEDTPPSQSPDGDDDRDTGADAEEPRKRPAAVFADDPAEAIADIAGGRARFDAVTGFGERNFLPEPEKSELAGAARRVKDADEALKEAARSAALSLTPPQRMALPAEALLFRPAAHLLDDLDRLGKTAERTLGSRAIPPRIQRDPRVLARVPYLNREDHAADIRTVNAIANTGGDAASLFETMQARLAHAEKWRSGEGALDLSAPPSARPSGLLGRLTETQPQRAASFSDGEAIEVARDDLVADDMGTTSQLTRHPSPKPDDVDRLARTIVETGVNAQGMAAEPGGSSGGGGPMRQFGGQSRLVLEETRPLSREGDRVSAWIRRALARTPVGLATAYAADGSGISGSREEIFTGGGARLRIRGVPSEALSAGEIEFITPGGATTSIPLTGYAGHYSIRGHEALGPVAKRDPGSDDVELLLPPAAIAELIAGSDTSQLPGYGEGLEPPQPLVESFPIADPALPLKGYGEGLKPEAPLVETYPDHSA